MKQLLSAVVLLLVGVSSSNGRADNACGPKMVRYQDKSFGWSACVPEGWKQRARGTELVWSGGQGLELVLAPQLKVVTPRDVSALLVRFLKKRGAEVHLSDSGDLKFSLGGDRGIGIVKHQHRFGLLVYTWCRQRGKPCDDLGMTAVEVGRTVDLGPGEKDPPYSDFKMLRGGVLELRASPGSPAAKDLEWLLGVYLAGYTKLLTTLGLTPTDEPLRIYFYRSTDEIYRYTRVKSGFAMNEAREVHSFFASRSNRQSTGHEMTHVLTHRAWGKPAEALMGEGIAVALDLSGQDQHLRAAKAIARHEPGLKLSSMLGRGWWKHNAEVSYAVSGSVVLFLMKKGGLAKIMALYMAKDLPTALKRNFGWTMSDLDREWRKEALGNQG